MFYGHRAEPEKSGSRCAPTFLSWACPAGSQTAMPTGLGVHMSATQTATTTTNDSFDSDLRTMLPRLRVYAMSLTRSGDRADDLVQQTVMKALAGRRSFR